MNLDFAATTYRAIRNRIRAQNTQIDEQTRHFKRCPTRHAYRHLELIHGGRHEP